MADDLKNAKPAGGLDFISGDGSVVDLRDAKSLIVDPSKVKGALAAGDPANPYSSEDLDLVIRSIHSPGWSSKDPAHLIGQLEALGSDGTKGTTVGQGYEAWSNMRTRENDSELIREAARTGGVGFPGAGQQSTKDCTLFALANAAGLPYGVVAARAAEMISSAGWRSPAEQAAPEGVFKKGLSGYEVIILAEAFGQAQVVSRTEFATTLDGGRPILLGVVLTEKAENDKYSQGYHEVVLTKSFRYKDETYFEMMDSNQPATARRYLTEKELGAIMFENGVAFRPDPLTTPKLFR